MRVCHNCGNELEQIDNQMGICGVCGKSPYSGSDTVPADSVEGNQS